MQRLKRKLTKREKRKIKKYGSLRFAGEVLYKEKVMYKIYEKAGEDKRKALDEEMDIYLQAIKQGDIKAGQSILEVAFSGQDSEAE